jgi:uncharacterized protein (DUF1501 family)
LTLSKEPHHLWTNCPEARPRSELEIVYPDIQSEAAAELRHGLWARSPQVRCVEVTLNGWDTHVNNHELQAKPVAILEPAFAALVRDPCERKLLERTVVLWLGGFGRTPTINPLGGRDHWPNGFSMAIASGRFRRGFVFGQTDPDGKEKPALPIGRTAKRSEGNVVPALLA